LTTSGTTSFDLNLIEIVEEAFERAGAQLRTGNDFRSARRSLNLLASEWANKGLNLWTVTEATLSLVAGTSSYDLPSDCIDVIEHSLRTGTGQSQVDYNLERVGVGTWQSLANKNQTGRPLQLFVERQIAPSVNIWPVPDQSYTLVYWYLRRIQDAGATGTLTLDVPHRFLPALVAGLAYHVALKKSAMVPEIMQRITLLKSIYDEQFQLAADEDRDRSSLWIAPYTGS